MCGLRLITGVSVVGLLLLLSVGSPMAQQSPAVTAVGGQQVTVGSAPDAAPIGAIMPFAGALLSKKVIDKLAQAGWLPCDGRSLSMDAFPELWENIGATWGAQPAQREFNLPDLRGRFGDPFDYDRRFLGDGLRRYGEGAARDRQGR